MSNLPIIFWAIPEPEIKGNLKWNSLCALNFFASLIKRFKPKKNSIGFIYFQKTIIKNS